jgi:hypothetical protein
MSTEMRIIKFSLGTSSFRYKFWVHGATHVIDDEIRIQFQIPKNIDYSLQDMTDNTFISLSTLSNLPDETNILIEVLAPTNLTTNDSTNAS